MGLDKLQSHSLHMKNWSYILNMILVKKYSAWIVQVCIHIELHDERERERENILTKIHLDKISQTKVITLKRGNSMQFFRTPKYSVLNMLVVQDRACLITKLLNVADRCNQLCNFQSCHTVLFGLQSPPRYMLHCTGAYICHQVQCDPQAAATVNPALLSF
jgi:hypothetical protein